MANENDARPNDPSDSAGRSTNDRTASRASLSMSRRSVTSSTAMVAIVALFEVFAGTPAYSQQKTDISGCNPALAKDIVTKVNTQEQDLDFISVVNEETFNQAKKEGTFGASVPLADDLLRISGTWKQFDENRRKYFQSIKYTSHYHQAEFQHLEVTSPLAYPAWTACVQALTLSNASGGLYMWKDKDDDNSMVVMIAYRIPAYGEQKYRKNVTLSCKKQNGDAQPVDLPARIIDADYTKNLPVQRTKVNGVPQALLVTCEAGPFAADVASNWQAPLASTTVRTTTVAASQDFTTSVYKLSYRSQHGDLNVMGYDLTVPGKITSVFYKGCDGAGCAFVHDPGQKLTTDGGQNIRSPDGKTETITIWTNYSGAADLPLHFTVNFDKDEQVCVGRDNREEGAGCPVRSPSDVLK
jgi:hypothetical protein